MTWYYNGEEFTEKDVGDAFGYVYRITNLLTGRIYVGKKFFTRAGRKTVKGKKKKIRTISDWENYYSSSETLNEDVEKHGKEHFHREILRLCASRSECSYYEAQWQFRDDVLVANTYNSWISVKVRRSGALN